MSFISRLKRLVGSAEGSIPTVASAARVNLSPHSNTFYVSGSTKIDFLNAELPIEPGRTVTLIGATSGTASLDNVNAGTAVKGQMDLGGSDRNVAADDVVDLIQLNDGTWRLRNLTDN